MKVPDPLPKPGTWAVTLDGSQYQIIPCCGHTAEDACSNGWADEDGCYIYSVEDDERYWYGWADLAGIGTSDEASAIAEDIP